MKKAMKVLFTGGDSWRTQIFKVKKASKEVQKIYLEEHRGKIVELVERLYDGIHLDDYRSLKLHEIAEDDETRPVVEIDGLYGSARVITDEDIDAILNNKMMRLRRESKEREERKRKAVEVFGSTKAAATYWQSYLDADEGGGWE